MKSLLLTATLLAFTGAAHAESIYCSFTEPFLTVTYNSETNKITVTSPDEGSAETTGHVTYQKGGILKITADGITQYLEVNLTKEGSDGMSDFVYPFEGAISNQLYGGCETDTLKKQPPKP
ncbi:hypothetical protein [uncultured Bdellovibrio sp.]|uniref:hypothetical protein n=1 Tax=Bdellovibrio sp. HCB-162 TaxID=3394234 RepID=UPI0025EFED92|nr:hypothetical protein [uncultured Bdellovibrio sp.]